MNEALPTRPHSAYASAQSADRRAVVADRAVAAARSGQTRAAFGRVPGAGGLEPPGQLEHGGLVRGRDGQGSSG